MKEGSIRERGSGIELRIRINGKQHSFYGKNEADARKKLREYRRVMKENADSVEYSKEYFRLSKNPCYAAAQQRFFFKAAILIATKNCR